MRRSVIHLIPSCGIGGVEKAAETMNSPAFCQDPNFDFRVCTLFPANSGVSRSVLWNPFHYLTAAIRIQKESPEILIVSLWRSCVVGLLLKIVKPKIKIVLFLHLSKDVHFLDWLLHRLLLFFAEEVWADSSVTLRDRIPNMSLDRCKVISFVIARIVPLEDHHATPVFVYWGRLHPQKDLARAVRLFARINQKKPEAIFLIIGPDGGELKPLQHLVITLGLSDKVSFLGPMEFSGIASIAKNASFYLQTSITEGMAMSVVEAMQLGLVPIVTPVGEIQCYAQHRENAILFSSEDQVCEEVLAVLDNEVIFQRLRARAIATWSEEPLYKDSVLEACRTLLRIDDSNA